MMKLFYNWNAVCAMKVLMCLEEKELKYDLQPVDLGRFEQLGAEYLKLNPAGVVPTFVHDGVVLLESSVINEFLDDNYPATPLRPEDPYLRAVMRWWGKQIDDVVHTSIRPISFVRFVTPIVGAMDREKLEGIRDRMPKKELAEIWRRVADAPYTEDELAGYVKKVDDIIEKMEQTLQETAWLAGEAISLADINMTPYFRRLTQLDRTEMWAQRPAVTAWYEKIRSRPSFAAMDKLREKDTGQPQSEALAS
jgi:glutathione S-transferase